MYAAPARAGRPFSTEGAHISTMLPFEVTDMLRESLAGDRRPPDGLLHPSGDLIGSLRHSQLRAAGAPTIESELVSDIRLMTGTLWHSYFESIFRSKRLPVMSEVRLDAWLPEGWSGTADWIVWNPEYRAFVLGDLKTMKGEGITWVVSKGMKDEHLWQLSSYWYALERMGIPLVKGFTVFYCPMNSTSDPNLAPLQVEGMPLDRDLVLGTMADRWSQTQAYLDRVDLRLDADVNLDAYLNEHLAPVQEREQKVVWSSTAGVFDCKLMPHWSAAYCPFPNELCNCREAGTTKIGHYTLEGEYLPRKGDEYEAITPVVEPTVKDYEKRRKAAEKETT